MKLDAHELEVSTCVRTIEDHFHRIDAELETLRVLLVTSFEAGPVDSATASAIVEPQVRTFLDRSPVIGAGYVAAPGALSCSTSRGGRETRSSCWPPRTHRPRATHSTTPATRGSVRERGPGDRT